jgi:hypothetical protein
MDGGVADLLLVALTADIRGDVLRLRAPAVASQISGEG